MWTAKSTRQVLVLMAVVVTLAWPRHAVLGQDTTADMERELTEPQRTELAEGWVDDLWAYYATGGGDLSGLMTAAGLDALRGYDWRYRSVEAGDQLFDEDPSLVTISTDWGVPEFEGGEQVAQWLELLVDVAPLAMTIDRASGKTTEISEGVQRRLMGVEFRREPGGDEWLVNDVGATQDPRFKFGIVEQAAPVPCPGFGSNADPFLARPWCTANGDGRRLVPGTMARSEIEMTKGASGSCWAGTYRVALGVSPGEPMGLYFGDGWIYVRDPNGKLPNRAIRGPSFKRNVRLPADAVSTGITNGAATIWTSASVGERAIFMEVGNRFERWPRTDYGCA